MQKLYSFIFSLFFISAICAQDQTINGNQTVVGNLVLKADDVTTPLGTIGCRLYFGSTTDNYDPMYMYRYNIERDKSELRVCVGDDDNDKLVVGRKRHNEDFFNKIFVVHTLGRVGIATEAPSATLDVNGSLKTRSLLVNGTATNENLTVNQELIAGKQVDNVNFGSIRRLTITPYRHTGGPWTFTSRDVYLAAFLDFDYGKVNMMTFKNMQKIGIFTQDPQTELDVNGKIRANELAVSGPLSAKQVKIEINAGADFVFEPDYRLMPLNEVESFVKENKYLPEIPSEKQMMEQGLDINERQIKLLQKIEELTLYVIEQNKLIEQQQERIEILEQKNK